MAAIHTRTLAITSSATRLTTSTGYNAVTAVLLAPVSTVNSNNAGVVATLPTGNFIRLYVGSVQQTTNITYGGTETRNNLVCTVNSGTGAITLTQPTNWTATDQEVFTITATYNSITYNCLYTVTKAKAGVDGAGSNAISAILTNESSVVPTASDGSGGNFAGAVTQLKVYNGTADDTSNWTVSVSKTNVTCTEAITSFTQTVTAMSADVGYIDFTASRPTFANITKRFIITKAKSGTVGSSPTAYWLVASTAAVAKSIGGVYTPASITFSAMSAVGSATPVSYTTGRYKIYENGSGTALVTTADVASYVYTPGAGITSVKAELYLSGGTTTKLDEQTIPMVFDGATGAAKGSAVAIIYKQNSVPGTPTGGTYNFVNSTLTAPSTWSTTQPAASATTPTYVSSSVFTTTNLSDTLVAPTGWSTPVIYALNTSSRLAYTLSSVNTPPATPTPAAGDLPPTDADANTGLWSFSPPATVLPGQYVFQSNGVYTPGGDISWSTPYLSTFKVGQLSALGVDTGNLTLGSATSTGKIQSYGNTGYGTAGIFLGYDVNAYKFSIGNGTNNLTFDGNTGILTVPAAQLSGAVPGTVTGGPAGWQNSNVTFTTGGTFNNGGGNVILSLPSINGQLGAGQLGAIIDATKFAAGVEPITNVSSVPGVLSTRTIFNTTDQKLYRWTGSAYTAAVPAVDLTGAIPGTVTGGNAGWQNSAITLSAAGVLAGGGTSVAVNLSSLAGTVGTTQIAANAVTAAKTNLAAIDVTSGGLTANSVTAYNIAADAVTAVKILAGTITADKLVANTITANEIAANAITASELAADAVTAVKILAGTITADKLLANTITANEIAANAITSSELAANSVIAGKILAGSVTATEIAAGAIRTDKLLVTGRGAALNDDPNMTDVSAWGNIGTVVTDTAAIGGTALEVSNGASPFSKYVAIDITKNYHVRATIKQISGATSAYLGVSFLDGAGAPISGGVSGWPGLGTYHYFYSEGYPTGSYVEHRLSFGPNETNTVPSNAKSMALMWYPNYSGGAGVQRVSEFRLEEKANADLIVDGAITAVKIAAGTITADRLASGFIYTKEINVNSKAIITSAGEASFKGLQILDNSGNVVMQAGATNTLNLAFTTPQNVPTGWQNNQISVSSNGTLNNAGGGQVTLPGMGLKTFRVVAIGNGSTTHPTASQLFENGASHSGGARSYTMHRIRRSDGVIEFTQTYDVYGNGANSSGRNAATLAADLNATTTAYIVVVRTHDEPNNERLASGLPAAMYRCGASRAVFGSSNFKTHSAYILVAIAGIGEGNGAEAYQGAITTDPNAWCDLNFQLNNGSLVGVSGRYSPTTIADYGYTGDLNASSDLVLAGASNVTINGNKITKINTNSWDGGAYSRDGYTGGAYASCTFGNNGGMMMGLSSNPSASASYINIDYAIYWVGDGRIQIYEGGASRGEPVSSGALITDVFTVVYDGRSVLYLRNGSIMYQRGVSVAIPLHFDCSLLSDTSIMANCRFGPATPNNNTNLLDARTWVINTYGSQPGFTENPTSSTGYNYIEYGALPSGDIGVVWTAKCGTAVTQNSEGGWNAVPFPIDNTKMYRFSVWVRTEGNASGSIYLGTGGDTVNNLAGGLNINPYFCIQSRSGLVSSKWYLLVGYVYPYTYSGTTSTGGIYRADTGEQLVTAASSFRWTETTRTTSHRAYQYYTTTTSADAYTVFWNPRVDICDGTEPSIASMLSMGSTSGRNKITSSNVSTFIASEAISKVSAVINTSIPTFTSSSYDITDNLSVSSYIIASITITTTGGPLIFNASIAFGASFGNTDPEKYMNLFIIRGTTRVFSKTLYKSSPSSIAKAEGFFVGNIEQPAAGTYTYYLTANLGTITGSVYHSEPGATLYITELKR